ncbi:hypothetical protein LINPERHAP1_LOCUS4176 [Linum perenne]
MAPFIFKSDNHFVASSDGTTLQVYELTKPLIHPSSIRNTHWNEVAKINIGLRHDTNEGISYNGLLFFDGHGRIEGRATLTTLAHHLMLLRLRVSPEGYCFQDVTDLGNYADFGIHYLFLNDLFCWPRHGVELVTITNWHRWDLEYHYRPRNEKTSKSLTGNVVSKEKYLELKKLLEDEHEELEKLKELVKLKEELEEANEIKDEELQKLRKEKEEELKKKIKMKEDELRFLKKKKDNEDGERKHQARRRQVPPEKFNRQELSYNFYIENIPNLTTGNNVNVYHTLYCVDDDDITEWRPPSTISIYVSKGGTGGFDVSNWWFTKATHPEGGLTMLAYYDGSHSNAPHANGPIPLPFSKDLKSIVPAQNFFMADLKPIGVRMAFAYRW